MFSSGYSTGTRLLGGLGGSPKTAAYSKGRAMASAAGLGLDQAKANSEMAVSQQQEDARQRMQAAGNAVQRAGNETQQRIALGGLANRKANFDLGMNYDRQGFQRRRGLDFRQALFNSLTQQM